MNVRFLFAALLVAAAAALALEPFVQASPEEGLICFEAEDCDYSRASDTYAWTQVVYPAGYSGAGAMRALPKDPGSYGEEDYLASSPRLDFNIAFSKPGTYYVWLRCYAMDGDSDSCSVGLDGDTTSGGYNLYRLSIGQWDWLNEGAYERVSICVVNTGVHTLNVYMREAGFRVDKIVLARDAGYIPEGYGPEAKLRGAGAAEPSAPNNLRAMAGSGVVCLNWDESIQPGFSSYSLMRSTTPGGPCDLLASGFAIPAYTDKAVENGRTYCYSVSASNVLGQESAAGRAVAAVPHQPKRLMENPGRGVVAVRTGTMSAFISWRSLALDPPGIGFNLYRTKLLGSPVKLNSSPIYGATCFTDTSIDYGRSFEYSVRPVINGVEQESGGSYTIQPTAAIEPIVEVNLSSGSTDVIRYVWPGDLDGDGEYEFVLDRQNGEGRPQELEAYELSGELLWKMSLGPNSTNTYNIEPGSSAIDVGHWDGVTVYDLDCDGRAEVLLRSANGVVFADGSVLEAENDLVQFVSVIDGLTGAERARAPIPDDIISDGPSGAQVGIGYLDGVRPSLITSMKNRIESFEFNLMVCAWDYDGTSLKRKWKWHRGATGGYSGYCPDSHNIRIADFDGDGMDEFGHIGYVLDSNGTVLYNLRERGIIHGDRWHVGKFDPSSEGLQVYGIQQDNAEMLYEYATDAKDGSVIWKYFGDTVGDVGRGDAGDMDPRYPGFECWSFSGICNIPTGTRITAPGEQPWPCLRIWWDGDELSEMFNDGRFDKWDYLNKGNIRLASSWKFTSDAYSRSYGGLPLFYGDILGDWREEVILFNSTYTKLGIFTTDIPTTRRLYTLSQNPLYRNCMTVKGYMQSHHLDYYLGAGMTEPPVPMIAMAGERFNAADITADGSVDVIDFAALAEQWITGTPAEPSADVALPWGIVDEADLNVLTENWLESQTD